MILMKVTEKMSSLASTVDQFGEVHNFHGKSASSVYCAVCGDLLPSVLSYHKHNVNKHTCYELSLAIIKLFGVQLEPKSILNEKYFDSSLECDSLYNQNNMKLRKEAILDIPKDISREEICQEKKHEDNNITNILQNLEGKLLNQPENVFFLGGFEDDKEHEVIYDGQYTNKECKIKTIKNNINRIENGRFGINSKKSISKTKNEGNDLYEGNMAVSSSKRIKLEEDVMLRGNKGLNICDYLVAEEVFLEPHDYTEEAITEEADVTVMTLQSELDDSVMTHSEADDSLHSLIQDENYIQENSNDTFSKYNHPQIMHQSENESENDYEFIPISGSEMEEKDDINFLAHSPQRDAFSTTDSISLASLIFLILRNSIGGLPVSVIDMLLQGVFPYFFKNLSYSHEKCDMLDLIRKTLQKERGFRKTHVNGIAYNDPVWETTNCSVSKYEEEIQNSSNLDDFTQSPALLKALKKREVNIDINSHGLPIISYSPQQQSGKQKQQLQQCGKHKYQQQLSFQKGNGENICLKQEYNENNYRSMQVLPEQVSFNTCEGTLSSSITKTEGYNDNTYRNMQVLPDQNSANMNHHSRSDKVENVLENNNNSELVNNLNHNKPDLKETLQKEFAKNSTENTHTANISKPKRKRLKTEDFLLKETHVLDHENLNEWESENIKVKSEPLLWGQEWDQGGQEWDNQHQNLMYEDIYINNYVYNNETIDEIDTETLNFSSESNQSTFENEANYVSDNDKELEGSEENVLPQSIYERICSTEESLQQRIPCIDLYDDTLPQTVQENGMSLDKERQKANTRLFSVEEKASQEEPTQQSNRQRIPCKNTSQEDPTQQSKQQRIPYMKKDMNKLKVSLDLETDNRNTKEKKQRKSSRKLSSAKGDGLIRNLTTHRINEKMRRKELNEQFDYLLKRLPDYGYGKSLPKIAILNKSKKYVSKLENANIKLLLEKESLEEYQQTLTNSLNKLK